MFENAASSVESMAKEIRSLEEIDTLREINGLSIEEIERRARPLVRDPSTGEYQLDEVKNHRDQATLIDNEMYKINRKNVQNRLMKVKSNMWSY